MCGVAGCVWRDPATVPDAGLADAVVDALAHRGPDDRGVWTGPGVFIGSRRLSIIDVAGGRQPIANEDETLRIVYNGELYNFRDLRKELDSLGHVFRTGSDTEVVLHAYEQWGSECLHRFNGMFAFAVWDARRRLLFVARDRIGEKPLYYFEDSHRLVFASEVKALLLDPGVPRRPDPEGIVEFLAYGHAHAPRTTFAGIRKLPPAHYMTLQDGRLEVCRYWDVADTGVAPSDAVTNGAAEDEIIALLRDSVTRRMVADVPVGAFLSGGLDSTAVVSMMRSAGADKLMTFSLGFEGGRAYDELPDARFVAEALGTEHHEIRITSDVAADAFEELAFIYDEPFGDAAGYPLYMLSRAARDSVKVVLTGEGGDELFGGYRRYVVDRYARAYGRLPGVLTERVLPALVNALPRRRRLKRLVNTMHIRDGAVRNAEWLRFFPADTVAGLAAEELVGAARRHDPMGAFRQSYARFMETSDDTTNALMYVDLSIWLHDTFMEKVDKATMAVGLEARQPLLDHRLVELAFRIPGSDKVRGFSTKRIFKRALAGHVPEPVLRKRKHGFAVPTDTWFAGPMRGFVREVLLDDRTRQRGLLDVTAVERVITAHESAREAFDQQLWLLLMLELWARAYLDGERVPRVG